MKVLKSGLFKKLAIGVAKSKKTMKIIALIPDTIRGPAMLIPPYFEGSLETNLVELYPKPKAARAAMMSSDF